MLYVKKKSKLYTQAFA